MSTQDDSRARRPSTTVDDVRTAGGRPRAVELLAAPLLGALGVAEVVVPFESRTGTGSVPACVAAVVVVAVGKSVDLETGNGGAGCPVWNGGKTVGVLDGPEMKG